MTWPISLDSAAITLAVALAVGMVAQALARHLRLPGIVLLLGAGVLLGPDGLDVVRPGLLGELLEMLVGFAVAVILFDGGMSLNIKQARQSARSIRQLITIGALVTWGGGALAARYVMQWSWPVSILFGSLVIVTGPTVINPLLRRLRVQRRVATILEAEGILIDAIGAIIAVVALEVALSGESLGHGTNEVLLRLVFGSVVGILFGLLVALLLKLHRVIPEGLENMLILALVLVVFQFSNAVLSESGLVSVTVAGLLVGNFRGRVLDELREFKEELTTLLIGMLFVILAADVRVAEVVDLGWRGVATVAALMFVVRPLNILASTVGTTLDGRQKLFLSWIAPRGIVAAAVASLFAETLHSAGVAGGDQLRALVFLVIASTVLLQGLTGAVFARMLGLRMPSNAGFVILGAGPIGLHLGRLLRSSKNDVVFLDSNPEACRAAEAEGFRVIFGNALKESILYRAQLDSRAGVIAVTPNEEINFLFVRSAREQYNAPRLWIALRRGHESVHPSMLKEVDARVLFGTPRTIDLWSLRIDKREAAIEVWKAPTDVTLDWAGIEGPVDPRDLMLPLVYGSEERRRIYDDSTRLRKGDLLWLLVVERSAGEAHRWLEEAGMVPATAPAAPAD